MQHPTTPPPDIWPVNDYEARLPHHHLHWVEGGTFMMGSDDKEANNDEKPVHPVALSSFCMARYPVTQALYKAVTGTNPSGFQGDDRPVERVSWEEVKQFIQILNEKTGRTHAKWQYSMPTEAQWEYAARGGVNWKDGFTYSGSHKLKEVGWYVKNSHQETKPVGMKRPNQLGIFDMTGNVWEWCQDRYDGNYYKECRSRGTVMDPLGVEKGSNRVRRGGSWGDARQYCRVASRRNWRLDNRFGFRLCLAPSQADA
jgi:sulfatase modifying factor 1